MTIDCVILQFHASIEGKLPQYNTRIKLPTTQRDMVYDGKNISQSTKQ